MYAFRNISIYGEVEAVMSGFKIVNEAINQSINDKGRYRAIEL